MKGNAKNITLQVMNYNLYLYPFIYVHYSIEDSVKKSFCNMLNIGVKISKVEIYFYSIWYNFIKRLNQKYFLQIKN